ncbi:hypothetical protein A2397_05620 [Candidatus Amesbacteria bacterium RIFOXYB1_FULL_44_23]|uniref:Uncharacterized protein n=1 Tax=Candidatus Amesbacteria bacterium RIFOXYB1_FULL_44_23 TaxID=1797263 RepID=A0A1F4ZP03_9BACT|nr:MAG: hypothetical protein A2397_05620 [Candidatus Amesbacteria bacterium RIFOXYB1_FULL_44_23]
MATIKCKEVSFEQDGVTFRVNRTPGVYKVVSVQPVRFEGSDQSSVEGCVLEHMAVGLTFVGASAVYPDAKCTRCGGKGRYQVKRVA